MTSVIYNPAIFKDSQVYFYPSSLQTCRFQQRFDTSTRMCHLILSIIEFHPISTNPVLTSVFYAIPYPVLTALTDLYYQHIQSAFFTVFLPGPLLTILKKVVTKFF